MTKSKILLIRRKRGFLGIGTKFENQDSCYNSSDLSFGQESFFQICWIFMGLNFLFMKISVDHFLEKAEKIIFPGGGGESAPPPPHD